MKKEKILINIENLIDFDKYKKIGINNFLFAVDDFSIGYNTFSLSDIENLDCNKYLLINRIFNTSDVDNFKEFIKNIKDIEGIVFEDISVFNILKDSNLKLIWNQNHFATNYSSINYWLDNVYSAVISNELTFNEVSNILNNCDKPLILSVFGKNPIMYSRRYLLSNFNNNFNINYDNDVILEENITKNEFLVKEYDKGTIIFNNTYYNLVNYIDKFNDDKVLFYLVYSHELDFNTMCKVINGDTLLKSDDGFMNRKTIYKLGDKK